MRRITETVELDVDNGKYLVEVEVTLEEVESTHTIDGAIYTEYVGLEHHSHEMLSVYDFEKDEMVEDREVAKKIVDDNIYVIVDAACHQNAIR